MPSLKNTISIEEIIRIKSEDRETGYFCKICLELSHNEKEKKKAIEKIVDDIQNYAGAETAILCEYALDEALNNKILHGNLEIDDIRDYQEVREKASNPELTGRKVKILYLRSDKKILLQVTDEGKGFDTSKLGEKVDFKEVVANYREGEGLGLKMIYSFMDSVRFYDEGRTIKMVKNLNKL